MSELKGIPYWRARAEMADRKLSLRTQQRDEAREDLADAREALIAVVACVDLRPYSTAHERVGASLRATSPVSRVAHPGGGKS